MKTNISTEELMDVLKQVPPSAVIEAAELPKEAMATSERPFYEYMKAMFSQHGYKIKDVILAADFSYSYGQKLLRQERHTAERDYILRLCLGGGLDLTEVQRALKLYGMSPLYPRVERDAVLISCLYHGVKGIDSVNDILCALNMEPLLASSEPG